MSNRHTEFDFGLSGLTSWFHERWMLERAAREVVIDAAANFDGAAAPAILEDSVRLLESSLPTWALTALWQGAVGQRYSLDRAGTDGRAWLREIADVCLEQIRRDDPNYEPPTPGPVEDALTEAVLHEVRAVGPLLKAATTGRDYNEVTGVVPALELAAAQADPDLAFRLFLRAMKEYMVPISTTQFARYEVLGERFGFGEFLVRDVEFLTRIADAPDPH